VEAASWGHPDMLTHQGKKVQFSTVKKVTFEKMISKKEVQINSKNPISN
jgi:hypothetical protein